MTKHKTMLSKCKPKNKQQKEENNKMTLNILICMTASS